MSRSFAAEWANAAAKSRETSDARRWRVLQHDDLCDRLERILRIDDARSWSGWVPPKTDPETSRGAVPINDSPIRRELVAIATEAMRREQAQADAEQVA